MAQAEGDLSLCSFILAGFYGLAQLELSSQNQIFELPIADVHAGAYSGFYFDGANF